MILTYFNTSDDEFAVIMVCCGFEIICFCIRASASHYNQPLFQQVRHMFDEIDYVLEGKNAERFATLYSHGEFQSPLLLKS